MSQLTQFVHWLLRPNNFEPFITATVGAFAGAWGAQIIIGRGQRRQAIASELHACNSALALSFTIMNTFLGLKKQQIAGLVARFDALDNSFKEFQKAPSGSGQRVFEFTADWQTLSPPKIPIAAFEELVFNKIGIRGRGLQAAMQLITAVDGLETSIRERNDLISEIRAAGHSGETLLQHYLGLPTKAGMIDARNKDYVTALKLQTDDCIFFSGLFFQDLAKYAHKLRSQGVWRHWFCWLPKIEGEVDWSESKKQGLIPSDQDYQPWLKGFQQKPPRLERIKAIFRPRKTGTGSVDEATQSIQTRQKADDPL